MLKENQGYLVIHTILNTDATIDTLYSSFLCDYDCLDEDCEYIRKLTPPCMWMQLKGMLSENVSAAGTFLGDMIFHF